MHLRLAPFSSETPGLIKAAELVVGGSGALAALLPALKTTSVPPAATDPLWWTVLLVVFAVSAFVLLMWGLLGVALSMFSAGARATHYFRGRVRRHSPSVRAEAGLASGVGTALSPDIDIKDALESHITRASSKPGNNEANWKTEGKLQRPIELGFKPRTLRFYSPVHKTVKKVPSKRIPVGSGYVIVTRFFDAGFMVDEVGTVGDVVLYEPYPEAKSSPDAVSAPASPKPIVPTPPSFRMSADAIRGYRGQQCLAYLDVENISGIEAKNARGRLIDIGSIAMRSKPHLDIPLAWAHPDDPKDPSRKSFHGTAPARLYVAIGGNPNWLVPAAAHSPDQFDQGRATIGRDGNTRIGVEVSADNLPPVVGWFRLRWWSSIRTIVGGTLTDVLLDYDDIEVENLPGPEVRQKGEAPRDMPGAGQVPSATDDPGGSPMFEAGPRAQVEFDDVITTGYDGPKLAEESKFTAKRSRFERQTTAEPRMPSDKPRVGAKHEGGLTTIDHEPVGVDDGATPHIDPQIES